MSADPAYDPSRRVRLSSLRLEKKNLTIMAARGGDGSVREVGVQRGSLSLNQS